MIRWRRQNIRIVQLLSCDAGIGFSFIDNRYQMTRSFISSGVFLIFYVYLQERLHQSCQFFMTKTVDRFRMYLSPLRRIHQFPIWWIGFIHWCPSSGRRRGHHHRNGRITRETITFTWNHIHWNKHSWLEWQVQFRIIILNAKVDAFPRKTTVGGIRCRIVF